MTGVRSQVGDAGEAAPVGAGLRGEEISQRAPAGVNPGRGTSGAAPLTGIEPEPGDAEASLGVRIEKLSYALEKMNLAEYTELLRRPLRLAMVNFFAGAARGLGIAFGFAVLSGVLLYVLQSVMWSRLPVIGSYIATIVRLVEHNLRP